MYSSLIQKHRKTAVWYQYSSSATLALTHRSKFTLYQCTCFPVNTHTHNMYTMKQQNFGLFTAWGEDVLSFQPLGCPWDEKPSVLQGTCLSPSPVLPLCKMTTHILKHIWLICTHRYLPCIYWEKPVLIGLPLLISFCLASTSLQNPIELNCPQCYPWDHGKMQGGKRDDVAYAGFQSSWWFPRCFGFLYPILC